MLFYAFFIFISLILANTEADTTDPSTSPDTNQPNNTPDINSNNTSSDSVAHLQPKGHSTEPMIQIHPGHIEVLQLRNNNRIDHALISPDLLMITSLEEQDDKDGKKETDSKETESKDKKAKDNDKNKKDTDTKDDSSLSQSSNVPVPVNDDQSTGLAPRRPIGIKRLIGPKPKQGSDTGAMLAHGMMGSTPEFAAALNLAINLVPDRPQPDQNKTQDTAEKQGERTDKDNVSEEGFIKKLITKVTGRKSDSKSIETSTKSGSQNAIEDLAIEHDML